MVQLYRIIKKMAGNLNKTVGINDFVRRQTKPDFVGSKITEAQLEKLRVEAEKAVNAGKDTRGYADFVRVVSIHDPEILCPIAKVTPENEKFLNEEVTKRRENEESYKHKFFHSKDVKGMPSHHVNIILYTKEQLDKEKEKNTGSDFDIISINAEPTEAGAPITPETMRRNIKGPEFGGSGHQHTEDEISHSEKFWKDHAMIKSASDSIPKEWESWSLTKAPEETSEALIQSRADALKLHTVDVTIKKPGSFLKALNKLITSVDNTFADPTSHHQKKQQHESVKQGLLKNFSDLLDIVQKKARKEEPVEISAEEQKDIINKASKISNAAETLSLVGRLFKEDYDVDYVPRDQRRRRLADYIREMATVIAHCGHCGIPAKKPKKKIK